MDHDMTNSSFSAPNHLTESAEFLLNSTMDESPYKKGAPPYRDWWTCTLLEKRGPMAQDLHPGLDVPGLIGALKERLKRKGGAPTLSVQELATQAYEVAQKQGKEKATDRDVIAAILSFLDSTEQQPSSPQRTTGTFKSRITKAIPTLEQFGEDFTQLAAQGKLTTVLGRDQEIRQVIETLCRSKKRNPALIGPAGVGKTALVEGLAQRIVDGDVPEPLKGCSVISLSAASMVSDTGVMGALEKRLKALLEEASQDGVLLFIDEVHSIMGAGGKEGQNDVASMLKPALARGDVACIVATTDAEYRQYITRDSALERRFNPVLINEISCEATLEILKSFRDSLQEKRPVAVDDEVLSALVRMADRFMRNRFFPDKALDLLDHCIASAITQGRDEVFIEDAQSIVQRKVGMPVDTAGGLARLKSNLKDRDILPAADIEAIGLRLQTTTENLDLVPKEPNISLLLTGDAVTAAEDLAATMAEAIFGSEKRVVTVDFARLTQDNHINVLVGSPAGYIGHGDPLPHDAVQQTPWCVVLWRNIHGCHETIRALLQRIMRTGLLKDNRGQTVYFSDTVIIATTASRSGGSFQDGAAIGFEVTDSSDDESQDQRDGLEEVLGKSFVDQFDLVLSQAGVGLTSGVDWVKENLLDVAGERYAARGLKITWDDTFVNWLSNHQDRPDNRKQWEMLLDRDLSPSLRDILNTNEAQRPDKVVVRHAEGRVVVVPVKNKGA